MDRKTASYVVMGLKKDDKGNAVGFAEPGGVDPELDHAARITALDGRGLEARKPVSGHSRHRQRIGRRRKLRAQPVFRPKRSLASRVNSSRRAAWPMTAGMPRATAATRTTLRFFPLINAFTGRIDQPGRLRGYAGEAALRRRAFRFRAAKARDRTARLGPLQRRSLSTRFFIRKGPARILPFLRPLRPAKPYPVRAAFSPARRCSTAKLIPRGSPRR